MTETGQRRTVVVGAGRVGRALSRALSGSPLLLSGRAVLADLKLIPLDTELLVNAAGPGGEAASCNSPALALGLHYSLLQRLSEWVECEWGRRLISLGTVAPNVGFYCPLKRLGLKKAEEYLAARGRGRRGRLLVVECGQIIGRGLGVVDSGLAVPGVVARFVRGAAEKRLVSVSGSGEQTIRYTPLSTLVGLIEAARRDWPTRGTLSPVSEPLKVIDVARACRRLVSSDTEVRVEVGAAEPPSYEAPTGERVPVPDFVEVLRDWIKAEGV